MPNSAGDLSTDCRSSTAELSFVDVLRKRACEQPNRIAFIFLTDGETEEESVTYGELDRRARAIAAWLEPLAVRGERVLLLYPPSLEYIASFFGCLYAGAVAVPAYPPRPNRSMERLETIAEDSSAAVALTTRQILSRTATLSDRTPALQRTKWFVTEDVDSELSVEWAPHLISSNTLAMLQYTSGSTAAPKGVMLSHSNLLSNSAMLAAAFEYSSDSWCVSWLPVYHDMGLIGAVLQPLYGGFPCTLMSPMAFLQRPVRWLQAISRYKATISGAPNFAYDLCIRRVAQEEKRELDLSSWLVAFNGAEPVRPDSMNSFAAEFEECGFRRQAFFPCYGLAEATLMVSGGFKDRAPAVRTVDVEALENHLVADALPANPDVKSIASCGRALLDQQILIADHESLTPCQPYRVGEVWVAGPSVALGYWGKPQETDETFNARLATAGDRPFLRTGDLGFMSDGELFVTGRLKDLIVIRGLNHYPQDIEFTVEKSHPALRPGCGAAFGLELAGQEVLALVYEVDQRQRVNSAEIIECIQRTVSDEHELRAGLIALVKPGTIPKTSSGKIQRRACRTAYLDKTLAVITEWQSIVDYKAEVDDTASLVSAAGIEEWLARRIAAKVGLDPVELDLDQPIAAYGIDSLAAIELLHGIELELGVNMPMGSFLQSEGISKLATEINTRLASSGLVERPARPDKVETENLLSHGQRALWYLQQLNPQSAAYNIAAGVRIRRPLDVGALKRTFEALVARHPALRTVFLARETGPFAKVEAAGTVNLRHIPELKCSDAELSQELVKEANLPFDLEHGPLMRVSLFSRSAGEHVLLVVVHHIAVDFWSLSLLIHEMAAVYLMEERQAAIKLPALGFQYADYVRWQEALITSPEGERLAAFWQSELAGELPVLNLPADKPRPPVQSQRGASHSFKLDKELVESLTVLGRNSGATLHATLLAAFGVLLHRHTSQEDILVGTLAAGRTRIEFAELVGYFVNPLVIRNNLAGDPSYRDFLSRTRDKLRAALDHQEYPFPLLVEKLQPMRDPSRSPIVQVMFMFQKTRGGQDELAAFSLGEDGARIRIDGLEFESVRLEQQATQFDLTLIMAETREGMGGSLQFSTDLFEHETIARLAERFITLLNDITLYPRRRISELSVMSAAEERQVLFEWNATSTDHQTHLCIHQLFERQVEKTPQAAALVFEDEALEYAELNRRANRLAHYLQSLGVKPEDPVALYVERSVEMLVGILGILKAGGAYVPLDPSFPRERLGFMLDDLQARVLVTQPRLADRLPRCNAAIVSIGSGSEFEGQPDCNPATEVVPENLAYVIYTSGSTGKPKGVMVSHRNVTNFFAAMNLKVGCDSRDTSLAVTSISFDISVLELLWTLVNGSRVVLLSERTIASLAPGQRHSKLHKQIDFSLFYFASDDSGAGSQKYRLLLEGARFADAHGFSAVWTPERHFHAFGGLYPNPSVTSAALAAATERIRIRAGSVVMPLHDPIRVAEEWSLVDNLSGGRVGIAFASGWHADDFVFFPQNYQDRKKRMIDGIETVRKLWRGETIRVRGGGGNELDVSIYPKPVQPELPFWLTAAGSPDTFVKAAELGAGVLTHLLGQSLDEVADRIKLYRNKFAAGEHDSREGHVTLMLHAFIGANRDEVKQRVRAPFTRYLKSSVGLIGNLVKSLDLPLDLDNMSERDMDDLLAYAFDRYFETSALFGTQETCEEVVDRLREIEVDEIACLIDFGIEADAVLAGLTELDGLKQRVNSYSYSPASSFEEQARKYRATLLQCTPSLMSIIELNEPAMRALDGLRALMIGGEALPPRVAREAKEQLGARLINLYGPTETTIWSAAQEVGEIGSTVPIGKPIANTRMNVLDANFRPVPIGVPGELFIGGEGVARGYFGRPDLTAERFIPDPFSGKPGMRLYRTGDIARSLPNGEFDFLGRSDHQVKIRGYRVELGEIEAAIESYAGVRQAVVIAQEGSPNNAILVAYLVLEKIAQVPAEDLRAHVKQQLPDYMAPSVFITLDSLPRTANGKVNRKALPAPERGRARDESKYVAPHSRLEQTVATVWRQILNVEKVGVHDNFFDLGGHSLLMAQAHGRLRELLKKDFPLIKLLEHPTVSSLAGYLAEDRTEQASSHQNYERAQKQRQMFLVRQRTGRQG